MKCLLCNSDAPELGRAHDGVDAIRGKCPKCGSYEISTSAYSSEWEPADWKRLLSVYCQRWHLEHMEPAKMNSQNLQDCIDKAGDYEAGERIHQSLK